MATITDNDKFVINTMFNPLYPLDFDKVLAVDIAVPSSSDNQDLEIKRLEEEGVKFAEENCLSKAIEFFTRAIDLNPKSPSSYNNRAQAYQLQNMKDEAIIDLNTAIELASVNNNQKKVLCLALTQRGILNRLLGKDQESLEDFKRAADLGSSFAKQQVLLENPYAAACNQLLAKMVKQPSCVQ